MRFYTVWAEPRKMGIPVSRHRLQRQLSVAASDVWRPVPVIQADHVVRPVVGQRISISLRPKCVVSIAPDFFTLSSWPWLAAQS